jgi:hypothetical protein
MYILSSSLNSFERFCVPCVGCQLMLALQVTYLNSVVMPDPENDESSNAEESP